MPPDLKVSEKKNSGHCLPREAPAIYPLISPAHAPSFFQSPAFPPPHTHLGMGSRVSYLLSVEISSGTLQELQSVDQCAVLWRGQIVKPDSGLCHRFLVLGRDLCFHKGLSCYRRSRGHILQSPLYVLVTYPMVLSCTDCFCTDVPSLPPA